MNQKFVITLVIVGAALTLGGFLLQDSSREAETISSFEECVAAGNPILESYPPSCAADGNVFMQDIGNETGKRDLIQVSSPRPNQTIASPLFVEGKARGTWFFEASFPVRLEDAHGNALVNTYVDTPFPWMTEEFIPFQALLEFEEPATEKGRLILEKSNPSGLPEHGDALIIPVVFGRGSAEETMTVQVHLTKAEEGQPDCSLTQAVERRVPRTQAVVRAALEQLLKGETQKEREQGLFASINPGTEIQSLTIEDGIARVDFSERLDEGVAGSCYVAAVRAQITNTLLQFETVDEVVISIDGRTEDILQP